MVIAFDPAHTLETPGPVLVAWCNHAEGKVGGVFPDKGDLTRPPSTYQRQYSVRGVTHKDTASCPPYFVVEWLPPEQVSYSPPPHTGQRSARLDAVYEPVDAVLRNVPLLTEELWLAKARLYGEHGDEKALSSLPAAVRSSLGLTAKWVYQTLTLAGGTTGWWECPVVLPALTKGLLMVNRVNSGWAWQVVDDKGQVQVKAFVKYAVEGMAAAEAKLPSLVYMLSPKPGTGKSKQAPLPFVQGDENPDDIPF